MWVERLRSAGVEVHVWEDERRTERSVVESGGKVATLRGLARAVGRRRAFLVDARIDLVHFNNAHRRRARGVATCEPMGQGSPASPMPWARVSHEPSRLRRILIDGHRVVFPLSQFMLDSVLDDGIRPERSRARGSGAWTSRRRRLGPIGRRRTSVGSWTSPMIACWALMVGNPAGVEGGSTWSSRRSRAFLPPSGMR